MKPAPTLARCAPCCGRRALVGEFGGKRCWHLRRAGRGPRRGRPACARTPWYFSSIAVFAQALESAGFEPRWLELVDRPTKIPTLAQGVVDWLRMFGQRLFDDLSPARADDLMQAAAVKARPRLWRDGGWVIDYRRLRFEAVAT